MFGFINEAREVPFCTSDFVGIEQAVMASRVNALGFNKE
jgi:hypothetical protein